MSFTFTKLFSSITESTVWMETSNIRIVWITMLAMADRRGRVWASIPGLANRARVPVEDCRAAIRTFLDPDKDSRTKDNEGRRIVELDGGWQLINHEKYRNIRDEETAKEAKRNYINERRRKERESKKSSTVEQSRTLSNQAEADTEAYSDTPITNQAKPLAPRPRNECFDALCVFEGIPLDQVTKKVASRIATALSEIKSVSPSVTAGEISVRGANYLTHFSSAKTAMALASHWGKCHEPASHKNGAVPWQVNSHEIDHSKGFFDT